MSVISNKWVIKDKPKSKDKKDVETKSPVPKLCRSNMTKTLRGTRK